MSAASRIHHMVLMAALIAVATIFAATAPGAGAYVNPAQAEKAAELGAAWFETTQSENGALAGPLGGGARFGEWTLTALAAGNRNAADAVPARSGPSAQDFYGSFWIRNGPGSVACPPGDDNPEICDLQPDGLPTDAARSALSAVAGGLQPSRISTSRDFISRLAFWWDGKQIGYRDLLNDDIFGILALRHAGAPEELLRTLAVKVRTEQLDDGGWHWRAGINPTAPADTDMTASAIGALCAAGADPETDSAVARGLALLQERQVGEQGGFSTSTGGAGVNTNSTAWVVSGLNACDIDPQDYPWVTAQGKTPLDFLVSMQNGNGSFRYMPNNPVGSANLMASYQAVSPLGGNDWSGDAPAREVAGEPAIKAAPRVAVGTTVPATLVIDQGPASSAAQRVRFCRILIEEGDDLAGVMAAAMTTSSPGRCAQKVATAPDGDGVALTSLNGGEGGWSIAVNGGPEADSTADTFGLGDMVVLSYEGGDELTPAAVVPVPQIEGKVKPPAETDDFDDPADSSDSDPVEPIKAFYPTARIIGQPSYRKGKVRVALRCPAGTGAIGCNVSLRFKVAAPGRKKFKRFAGTALQIRSGNRRVVRVKAGPPLRRALRSSSPRRPGKGHARIRVAAGTRSADGVVSFSRVTGLVRGR